MQASKDASEAQKEYDDAQQDAVKTVLLQTLNSSCHSHSPLCAHLFSASTKPGLAKLSSHVGVSQGVVFQVCTFVFILCHISANTKMNDLGMCPAGAGQTASASIR